MRPNESLMKNLIKEVMENPSRYKLSSDFPDVQRWQDRRNGGFPESALNNLET
jgi:hypothetical protein